ncbi:helix-turn-helix transcriptional regulator [Pseudonocardia alaniniphila]|uniref:LuxR C-terminal-related transcriptional regulator n=1 Tax=Pseudonocardia alaniniphila TaxID=75291 RepID=A0ABS9TTP9_9PSEU|nr:LuxR family transcriptional regulator [Pseudonocardia alaniniphila]MCH6171904.1 LuxR C-terminal-related transcriptional regulator [Pseudonocardia alaniniphila]
MADATAGGSPELDEVPTCLRRLGLVVPSAQPPGRVRVVPPSVAATHHLAPLERAISRTRTALATVTETFELIERAYNRGRTAHMPDVVPIHGQTEVEAALQRSLDECRTELITAHPGRGRSPEILADVLERDLPVLRRGVRKQVIYQHTIRIHGPTLEYVDSIVREGAEARTLSELFDRLIVFDRKIAYIASPSRDEHELIEIHQPALVRYLSRAFDLSWSRATPVPTAAGYRHSVAVTSDIQRSIMRMLVNGLTDDKIARELGMGRRTVAEHVRRLSERFGSSGRAQLGYAIARSGLLDVDGHPQPCSGPPADDEPKSDE